ncbi:helix-turn-helix domain-containing protein [Paenibacillus gansuensis]|uniref:Helix-turn-helix domain-containing protein n=1 Tax=Paenibacillus gansuensis TaxID=306542 RepID=A0ABW5PGC4_9BACL
MRWTYNTELGEEAVPNVPEFVMAGSDDIRKALRLDLHAHPGCYEFVLVERGQARWELDGRLYDTQAGDVFHSRPGEQHRGGFNIIEPCKFWWLIIREPSDGPWLQLQHQEIRLFREAMESLPRVIRTGPLPSDTFRKLQKCLVKESPYRSIALRQTLLDLLLQLIQPLTGNQSLAEDLMAQFDRIIQSLKQNPAWRPSVQELASSAGVSESHFYRTFQEYTGEPPITFIERSRIQYAGSQLSGGRDSVTQIAFRLGYQTSQHFATAFKRYTGMTPTQWRKSRF